MGPMGEDAQALERRNEFWAERDRRVMRQRGVRRQAALIGAAGFLGAVALPLVLWHRVLGAIASEFHLSVNYLLTGWSAWFLIGCGLAFFVPVAASAGLPPDHRLYPRSRNALAGWGITLYLLGFALASQVSQITDSLSAY